MSIRIGWSSQQPQERGPQVGRHLAFFEYTKLDGPRGKKIVVGWLRLRGEDLLRLRDMGTRIDVRVVGWLSFAGDVTDSLIEQTLARVHVTGRTKIPPRLRPALARASARS